MKGRILLIGESIATAGTGLNGDIITTTALGGQALAVPTFLSNTLQPTKRKVFPVTGEFVELCISNSFEHPGVDAIKIGAINDGEILQSIIKGLSQKTEIPVVINTVLTSETGQFFLDQIDLENFKTNLLNKATLLVVNIRDAEILSGVDIITVKSMGKAAKALLKMGCQGVLITGGLLSGDSLVDLLVTQEAEEILSVKKHYVHLAECYRFGGGWALATAIATSLGQGFKLKDAINRGRQFVDKAIGTSFNANEDYQNLNLAHTIHPFVHDDSTHPYTVIPGKRFKSVS